MSDDDPFHAQIIAELREDAADHRASGNVPIDGSPVLSDRAADCIEKLQRNLVSRDNFLVSRDLFSEYVKTLD